MGGVGLLVRGERVVKTAGKQMTGGHPFPGFSVSATEGAGAAGAVTKGMLLVAAEAASNCWLQSPVPQITTLGALQDPFACPLGALGLAHLHALPHGQIHES